ncbi:MAG: alpha-L-glutamate ligase [Gammaproteobacteria bacterium RBG_16_57_12]|nr:MAG: alpha-L-glutamate ligase [Gammaproteobacteria bacterium RBG_16_57_12]
MRLVSFDAFRTLGIPKVSHFKPENMFRIKELIREAEWILFPEYWQINALVYGLNSRIFPSLASYYLGHDKIEMTRLFQALCPEHVPGTLILDNSDGSQRQVLEQMDFPFVAKEVKNSMGRGVYLIEDLAAFRSYCQKVDILYVQEYLPIDRDMRLLVIGDQVVGGYWRVAPEWGFHNNVAQGGQIVFDPIPEQARALVQTVIRKTGINHAGFDVAMVGNHCYLLEFNRLFGNAGVNQLGLDINRLILDYLQRQYTPPSNQPRYEMTGA